MNGELRARRLQRSEVPGLLLDARAAAAAALSEGGRGAAVSSQSEPSRPASPALREEGALANGAHQRDVAVLAHGTTARYRDNCRCAACARAWSLYRRLDGRRARVEAEPACAHLRQLAAHGVGLTQAARLSGLSRSTLQSLRNGKQRTAPASLVAAVLAIPGVPALGAHTRAWPTRRVLAWFRREGFTQHSLGARLGVLRLRLLKKHCTYRSAARVRALYRKVAQV